MGQVYCGAYADVLAGGWHEGYAAMELPDGELTATWTAATVIVAQVAACDCGWRGSRRHPPDAVGEDAALGEWRREHLDPLIASVAREGWAAWAARTAARGGEIATAVAAGRLADAAFAMRALREDWQTWDRVLDALIEETGR